MTDTMFALELADRLIAIAEHLRSHEHLPAVNVNGNAYPWKNYDLPPVADLQIRAGGAESVLLWAKTLSEPHVRLLPAGEKTGRCVAAVRGALADGRLVDAWDVDRGDLFRWRSTEYETPITLAQLAAYVAAGTVEQAAEHAPAVTS